MSPDVLRVVRFSSGEIQIGQINLDIQLTVNSSYLKPRIEELSKLSSKELDVKSSQVSKNSYTNDKFEALNTVLFANIEQDNCEKCPSSQVYLSNLTSKGNNSLIRMVVVPPEPSSSFTNVTAMV